MSAVEEGAGGVSGAWAAEDEAMPDARVASGAGGVYNIDEGPPEDDSATYFWRLQPGSFGVDKVIEKDLTDARAQLLTHSGGAERERLPENPVMDALFRLTSRCPRYLKDGAQGGGAQLRGGQTGRRQQQPPSPGRRSRCPGWG